MKYRITTDYTVEASGIEDAIRQFATGLMAVARNVSEGDHTELNLDDADGRLSVTPVKET